MQINFNFGAYKLEQCLPYYKRIDELLDSLCHILPQYNITTPQRVAAFLTINQFELKKQYRTLDDEVHRACQLWSQRHLNSEADTNNIVSIFLTFKDSVNTLELERKYYSYLNIMLEKY